MPNLLFLSWRYWRNRPSLVLSMIFALLLALGFVPVLLTAAWQLGLRSNAMQSISADIRLVALSKEGSLPIAERLPSSVKAQSSVLLRESIVRFRSVQESLRVLGVEPQRYTFRAELIDGRFLNEFDGRSLVISETLASRLQLKVLDTVELTSSQGYRTYRIVGISSEQGNQALMPLDEARLVFGSGQSLANWLDLELYPESNVAEVAKQLGSLLAQEFTVLSSDGLKRQPSYAAQGLELFLITLAALTAVAALYLLLSNLSLLRLERRKSFAVLGALGLTDYQLKVLLQVEFLAFNLVALGLSFPLAKGLERSLSSLAKSHVFSLRSSDFNLSFWRLVLLTLLSFCVLQMVCWLALKLKGIGVEAQQNARLEIAALLPNSIWLSNRFFRLFRTQDSFAFGFLILSLGLIATLFSLMASYQESLKALKERSEVWDLVVYQRDSVTGISVPLEAKVGDMLRQIGGVIQVASDTQIAIRQANLSGNLLISDTAAGYKTLSGVAGSHLARALKEGQRIAVAKSLADLYGLKVGASLNFSTAKGNKAYQIIAIVDDSGSEPRGIYMDRHHFEADWRYHVVDYYSLVLAQDINQETVIEQIKHTLGGRYLIDVIPASSIAAKAGTVIANSFRLGQVLSLLFIVISILGFASVGKEKLYALKKKFRLLSYLGASRAFMLRLFMGQVVLRAIAASLLSLALGGWLSFLCIKALRYSGRYSINWVLPVQTYGYLMGLMMLILLVVALWSARVLRKLYI